MSHQHSHHRQFDHKYRPERPQNDTGDTENDKNRYMAFISCYMLTFRIISNEADAPIH